MPKTNKTFDVPTSQVFTPDQVAKRCKCPVQTVYSWIRAGKLPCYTREGSNRRFVLKKDLDRFVKEVRVKG